MRFYRLLQKNMLPISCACKHVVFFVCDVTERTQDLLHTSSQGLREGGSGGTLYPGPGLEGAGLKGPGRAQVSALSFSIAP